MRTKIAYVINNDVISTCRMRTQYDNESDVTWHHVIVHGCKGQYLHARTRAYSLVPRGGGLGTTVGACAYITVKSNLVHVAKPQGKNVE